MKRSVVLIIVVLTLLIVAGPQSIGRIALWSGFNSVASLLLKDPAQKGVALYRAGRYAEADEAFANSGRSQTYNRGLSLAATGNYRLSLAYFDAVLFANNGDQEARANRELVATLADLVIGHSNAPGRLAAIDDLLEPKPDETRNGRPDPMLGRKLKARGIAATDAWIDNIIDDPGEFLKLRLKAEYERRINEGELRPRITSPW